jgi:phosphoribosylanthranilate isomerase
MLVKICGIKTLSDAVCAQSNGAWALGFNFFKESPRYIDKYQAKMICQQLPSEVMKVGVMPKVSTQEKKDALRYLNYLQVYELEQDTSIDKKRLILALQANQIDELPDDQLLSQYAYILLDAPRMSDGLFGGTGRTANWVLAATLAQKQRLILAGGLQSSNVQLAIKTVHPFAVDVASGVEASTGIKSHEKMTAFLKEVSS